jgi:hypothetical protein
MLPLVAPLTDLARHGGDPAGAFDVVIPSLPGVAYSEVPADTPLTRPIIADLWSDCDGDIERRFNKDTLLTIIGRTANHPQTCYGDLARG